MEPFDFFNKHQVEAISPFGVVAQHFLIQAAQLVKQLFRLFFLQLFFKLFYCLESGLA